MTEKLKNEPLGHKNHNDTGTSDLVSKTTNQVEGMNDLSEIILYSGEKVYVKYRDGIPLELYHNGKVLKFVKDTLLYRGGGQAYYFSDGFSTIKLFISPFNKRYILNSVIEEGNNAFIVFPQGSIEGRIGATDDGNGLKHIESTEHPQGGQVDVIIRGCQTLYMNYNGEFYDYVENRVAGVYFESKTGKRIRIIRKIGENGKIVLSNA